jgi:energy-coupling factor transporter ATP-binding protein EcfA2
VKKLSEEEKQNVWLELFLQESSIKDVVIVTGNIQDEYLEYGIDKYLDINQFLAKKMLIKGFKCVGFWNKCNGLKFPSKEIETIFRRLINSVPLENKTKKSTEVVKEVEYETGDTDLKEEVKDSFKDEEGLGRLLKIYSKLRKEFSIALIFDWTDFWTSDAQHLRPDEQSFFNEFTSTINSFLFNELTVQDYERPNSTLIFLTRQLGIIPPILYSNNARAKIITIPLPERKERREFMDRQYNAFKFDRNANIQNKTSPKRTDYLDLFADQTDGLRIVDLEKLLLLSNHLQENLPLEKLINLYKFGKKKSPWEDLSEDRLLEIEEILKRRVIGQDDAIHKVATTIVRAFMGLSGIQHSESRTKPKGVLFFAGPTGVGKTELAKTTAEFLFRDEKTCIRFDMSEYMHEHSDQRLIGAPPGYVGFEDGGQLTNAVMAKPFCVLLFDEIEKAHPRILDIFLQVLEDGRLTDGRGQTVSFSETIIIFTSNLGTTEALKTEVEEKDKKKAFLKAIRDHFFEKIRRPELLNRIGENIVIFNSIQDPEFRLRIIQNKIEGLVRDIKARYNVKFDISPEVLNFLRDKADIEYGGRGLINVLESYILDPLGWFLFKYRRQLKEGRLIRAHIKNEKIEYTITEV